LVSWPLTEPNFSNPEILVPAFKYAVQPGHFVKVVHSGTILIGRIIGTYKTSNEVATLSGLAKVNWFSVVMILFVLQSATVVVAAEILAVLSSESVLVALEVVSAITLIGLTITGSSLSVGKINDVC